MKHFTSYCEHSLINVRNRPNHLNRNVPKCCWRRIKIKSPLNFVFSFGLLFCFIFLLHFTHFSISYAVYIDHGGGNCCLISKELANIRLFHILRKLLFVFCRKSWCYFVTDNHFIQLVAVFFLPAFLHLFIFFSSVYWKANGNF